MDKYQEALGRAKKEYENADGISREILERIFPGLLQETEDERLRKTTISFLEEFKKKGYENAVECIEWLEKQKPIFEDSEQRDPWEYIEKFKSLYGHYPKDADEIGVIVSEMVKKRKSPVRLANCSTEDLTEFESSLYSVFSSIWQDYMLGNEINVAEVIKEHSVKLLEVANRRKPIEWGEKDENMLNKGITTMKAAACGFVDEEKFVERFHGWLRSLKLRLQWKPSEEQLLSLKFIIKNYPDYVYNADLESLYEDLKKL